MARLAGDSEMVRKLTPPPTSFNEVKKQLMASVRHGRVDSDLWNLYVEAATANNPQLTASTNYIF